MSDADDILALKIQVNYLTNVLESLGNGLTGLIGNNQESQNGNIQQLTTVLQGISSKIVTSSNATIAAIRKETSIRTNEIIALKQQMALLLSKIGVADIENNQFINYMREDEVVYMTANPDIKYANGTIQVLKLVADGTLQLDMEEGQSMTLFIQLNGHTLNTDVMELSTNSDLLDGVLNIAPVFCVDNLYYCVIGDYFNEIS